MREAEEVKRLWLLPTSLGSFFSEPSKLQQSRLCCFQFQMKLCQPFSQFLKEPFSILAMLEAGQKVVRITKVIGFSPARPFEPSRKPQVQRVM